MTYIDGFLAPVLPGRRDDYAQMATEAAQIFIDHGAMQVVEAFGDDVPEGKLTDMWRAVDGRKAEGEGLVFSWIVWPSKEARDSGWGKAMADERMKSPADNPFDPKRMIYGGFDLLVDTSQK
jgi:uncharacterized protein YbaA (DUF1428 family)